MSVKRNKFPTPPPVATTSKFDTVRYKDVEGKWRVKVVAQRTKFNDAEKELFLAEYRKWGRMGDSAAAAGVTPPTVRNALAIDPDFAEACLEAESDYHDKLIAHHQDLIFNGTEKKTYDRTGNLVSEEKVYPIRLIELELKKHDEGYRDKREVKMDVTGGVLVAPPEVQSIDDWQNKFGGQQKPIEGEYTEADPESADENSDSAGSLETD